MKTKLLFIIAFMTVSIGAFAQSPYTFNYQSVVRDANGLLLENENVGVQITILQGSVSGTKSYQETFNLNTNDFALINLKVGTGTVVSGDMTTIDWSSGPYFMEVAMDFTGGNTYVVMGATELVSVPFALHAKTAENIFSGDYNDLNNLPTNVSHFTNDAGYLATEVDGSITNEIQALSLSNDTVFLSDGGFIKLPVLAVGFNGQYTSLIGAPTNVSHFTNDAGYLTTEVDGSITNEIQTMTFSNDSLHLTSGGDVDLSGFDNSAAIATNATNITTNTSGIATNATGISTNATGISTNSSAISANTTSITTNTGNIATNTTGIATNATAIGTNTTGIATNTTGIATNATAIGTNTTGIATNATSISTHITNDLDTDATNEIQSLTLSGTTLSLSSSNSVDLQDASVWDTNVVGAYYLKNIGVGLTNPEYRVHASGDSMVIAGYSTGQHADNWRNVGVYGETNTDNNPGRGVSAHVYGTNYGLAIRGEAATDKENQGVSGYALSKPGNTINQFGVYGEARKHWSQSNSGTGTHWGGYFIASGEGAFNIGIQGEASTPGTGANRGVTGNANSNTASDNIGIIGFAQGTIAGTNRGAYGQANNSTGTNYGMNGAAYGAGTNQTGVYGYSNGTNGNNYGVDGTTEGTGSQNVGTGGFAYGTNTGGNKNYGIYAYAQNADTNYGVYSTVTGSNNVNYGVYSEVSGGSLANYGLYGKVTNTTASGSSFGVYGLSDGVSANSNTGIRGYASGSSVENTGVFGYATGAATYGVGLNGQAFNTGTGSYGVFAYATGSTNNYAGYFAGNVTITGNLSVTGNISKGGGTFKIDHPLDPENKYLVHSFVESDEMMNVYSGNITTDANGYATVDLPSYFEAANKDFRYQLTVIGSFAQAIIKEEVASNKFVIQTNTPNVKVSWQVSGVRADKYADAHRVVPELAKTKKGTYLHPELFGATKEQSENADSDKLVRDPNKENAETSTNPGIENMKEFLDAKKKTNSVPASPQAESMVSQGKQQAKTENEQAGQEPKPAAKR